MANTYIDVDLSFKAHPISGDLLKKTDVSAVKQALRNIFMTNKYECPFQPDFGLGIAGMLFENYSPVTIAILERRILEQITQYDYRIVADDVKISSTDNNELDIEFSFHVIGDADIQTVNYILERTR